MPPGSSVEPTVRWGCPLKRFAVRLVANKEWGSRREERRHGKKVVWGDSAPRATKPPVQREVRPPKQQVRTSDRNLSSGLDKGGHIEGASSIKEGRRYAPECYRPPHVRDKGGSTMKQLVVGSIVLVLATFGWEHVVLGKRF